jgi:hypothetical protein
LDVRRCVRIDAAMAPLVELQAEFHLGRRDGDAIDEQLLDELGDGNELGLAEEELSFLAIRLIDGQ